MVGCPAPVIQAKLICVPTAYATEAFVGIDTVIADALFKVTNAAASEATVVYVVPVCELTEYVIVGDVNVRSEIVVTVAPDAIEVDPIVGAEYPDTVPQERVPEPSVVRYLPEFDVCDGSSAAAAVDAVVAPVPPLAIGRVPVTPVVNGRPVAFVRVPDAGVPSAGVTSVGELANTRAPVPVSSVTAEARFEEDGVARNVATLVPRPLTPVLIGRPVAFVRVAEAGVPSDAPFAIVTVPVNVGDAVGALASSAV